MTLLLKGKHEMESYKNPIVLMEIFGLQSARGLINIPAFGLRKGKISKAVNDGMKNSFCYSRFNYTLIINRSHTACFAQMYDTKENPNCRSSILNSHARLFSSTLINVIYHHVCMPTFIIRALRKFMEF